MTQERARRLMLLIEAQVGGQIESKWQQDRYLAVLGALIEEIEISMNAAKEWSA